MSGQPVCRSILARPGRRGDRSAGLRVGDRVVRVLEAADEQHCLRVGRRDLAAVRPGAEPDGRHRHRRARARPDLVHAHGRRQQRLRLRDGAGAEQSARLGGALARAPTVCLVGSDDRSQQRRRHLPAHLGRQPGEARRALLRRLRVRLHDAEPAPPRHAGEEDDRAGGVGVDRLERSALDAQLPAGDAQREGGRRRDGGRERNGSGRDPRQRRQREHPAGHLPRLQQRRGLPGRQLHPDSRQPGGRVAAPAHHHRRCGAGRVRHPRRRAQLQPDVGGALVPGLDRRHRDRRRQRLPAAERLRDRLGRQPPARSGRPARRVRQRLRADRPVERRRRRQPAGARSTSTAIRSRSRTRRPTALRRCTIARSA